jgi:archaemetzincin
MEPPHYAYNEKRSQYHSKAILKRLLLDQRQDSIRLIGVTNVDLYVPILKYVYGLALIDGHCAVISLHRLRPEFYNKPPNPDLLMERVEKTVLHELGHSMGLTHCIDRRCIMYSSTRIGDTDHKSSRFCPTCSDLFRWYLGKCLEDDNA